MMEKPPIIHCSFTCEASLHKAYMPFVTDGGLFIQTNHLYCLGEEVELSIRLMNDEKAYLLSGRVVWITPQNAQGNKPQGIGVQLIGKNKQLLRNEIEMHLSPQIQLSQRSDTI